MRGFCTAEQKAACPLRRCEGSNTHHLAFPANQYTERVGKHWRELDSNKTQTPTCLHRAIHASGYVPEKLSRDEMLAELNGTPTLRALSERATQLAIGQALMQGEEGYFGGDAA